MNPGELYGSIETFNSKKVNNNSIKIRRKTLSYFNKYLRIIKKL